MLKPSNHDELSQETDSHKMPLAYLEMLETFNLETTTDERIELDPTYFNTIEEEFELAERSKKTVYPEYEDYYVYEDPIPIFKLENNYWERSQAKRATHFYSRTVRFRSYLYHIIGSLGTTPDIPISEILADIELKRRIQTNPSEAYELVYEYLRKRKRRKSYISIPWIINCLGGPRWKISYEILSRVETKFIILHTNFNNLKTKIFNRIRFPKLQYVVLRMLLDEGVEFPYNIPLTRTQKRQTNLDVIYHTMKRDIEYLV
jgi:hypothetical protein